MPTRRSPEPKLQHAQAGARLEPGSTERGAEASSCLGVTMVGQHIGHVAMANMLVNNMKGTPWRVCWPSLFFPCTLPNINS